MKQTKNLIMFALLVFGLSACGSAASQADKEAALSLSLGDIVLADGSVVKGTDFTAIEGSNVPIAVIAGWREDGTAFGIGVHRSDTPLQWTEDETGNHPAFTFADNYGESYELSGEYASGWSMPDIEQLREIYQNRETINASLQKICSLDSQAAMNGLETNWYWSSSPAEEQADYVWFIHYFNGYASECPQNFTNVHALAIHSIDGGAF